MTPTKHQQLPGRASDPDNPSVHCWEPIYVRLHPPTGGATPTRRCGARSNATAEGPQAAIAAYRRDFGSGRISGQTGKSLPLTATRGMRAVASVCASATPSPRGNLQNHFA